jgi:uncharacterized protein
MNCDRAALDTLFAADPDLAALLTFARARSSTDPGHDLAHCLRVAQWAVTLGAPLGVAAREAVAAALLHDIVNVPKDHPDRAKASTFSADFAREHLPAFGFDPDSIARIAGAIRDHSFSRGATPETALGDALQDADRLEALGVIGLFRCVSTGVLMGARYFHDADPWAEARPLDDRAFSIDHFAVKLLRLPATMRTPAGRAEAERRAAYLRHTLDELAHELGITAAPRPGS